MPETENNIGVAIDRIIDEVTPLMTEIRRDIHNHPETGFDTFQTAARVAKELRALGLSPQEGVGRTGVVAEIKGAVPGPCIILRADMDALPIQEQTGLPFASSVPGKMHACGHDLHTAALIGAATALTHLQKHLKGTVRLVFQPAEETVDSGAAAMIADGVHEGADIAIGFHNMPGMPAQDICLTRGASLASCDDFSVTLRGISGHAAHPDLATDPIVGAAAVIMQLQTIVSRRMSPSDPLVLTIGQIAGGHTENIIPDTCQFSGTIRCRSSAARRMAEAALRSICTDGARAMGLVAEVDYKPGVPALVNDDALVDQAQQVLSGHFETDIPVAERSDFGCEDFALFCDLMPTLHIEIGSGQPGRDDKLHNSDYQPDERFLPASAKALARLVFDLEVAASDPSR